MSVVDVATLRPIAEAANDIGAWKWPTVETLKVEQFDPLDAAHIAAFDPPTVLALLAELDTLRATVARVEALADERDAEIADINATPDPLTGRHSTMRGFVLTDDLRAALVSPTPDQMLPVIADAYRDGYGVGTP